MMPQWAVWLSALLGLLGCTTLTATFGVGPLRYHKFGEVADDAPDAGLPKGTHDVYLDAAFRLIADPQSPASYSYVASSVDCDSDVIANLDSAQFCPDAKTRCQAGRVLAPVIHVVAVFVLVQAIAPAPWPRYGQAGLAVVQSLLVSSLALVHFSKKCHGPDGGVRPAAPTVAGLTAVAYIAHALIIGPESREIGGYKSVMQ